jgi:hypothetical protein
MNAKSLRYPFIPVSILIVVILVFSCTHEPSGIDDIRTICFDTEVLPIFLSSCATNNCHDATAQEGLRLDSYEGILAGVYPGNSGNSEIYESIIDRGEDRMPPDHPISLDARMLIRIWIDQGADEVNCLVQSDSIPGDSIPIDTSWINPLVCFERDILPVFQSSCATTGCHDPISRLEGYDFSTYAGILEEITPGDPGASKIYEKITEDEPQDIMPPPPYDPLAQAEIDSIYRWILLGAKDEYCGSACDTAEVTYSSTLAPLIATYCIGCHSAAAPSGGVILETHADVVAQVNAGKIPGVIRREGLFTPMPPAMALSECNIRKFEIWIEAGMADN